jgi:hypothetical protein
MCWHSPMFPPSLLMVSVFKHNPKSHDRIFAASREDLAVPSLVILSRGS